MPDDAAIKVSGISKDFILPHAKVNSVKGLFTGLTRRGNRGSEVQHALKDISFEIKKGEFFGIVGRNGSGKSTLLKILAGIYTPTKGSVQRQGTLVPFIELGVGFNPELSGRENIYLNGAMFGFSEKEITDMYDDIVAFAELERFMDQKLKNYSSGMQVRLAFSMAVRADADILLIDEVLAVGDADFQRKCFEYFKSLKRNKKTVVFVSHDMDAIREYCDKAVLIENSRIIKQGTAEEVAQNYTRLFSEQNQPVEQSEISDRWGDGSVQTEKISVKVSEKSVVISETVRANQKIDGCIIGIRIRDSADKHVLGTNTHFENKKIGSLKKGDRLSVEWSVPNILSTGEYFVDPAIVQSDGITVCDWWDYAVRFKVNKGRSLPYSIDPDITVSIRSI